MYTFGSSCHDQAEKKARANNSLNFAFEALRVHFVSSSLAKNVAEFRAARDSDEAVM